MVYVYSNSVKQWYFDGYVLAILKEETVIDGNTIRFRTEDLRFCLALIIECVQKLKCTETICEACLIPKGSLHVIYDGGMLQKYIRVQDIRHVLRHKVC